MRVADVFVGTAKKIELKDWVPTLTLDIEPGISWAYQRDREDRSELDPGHPARRAWPRRRNPSPEPLRNGATIPVSRSSSFPTVERTLASLATVLRGGGIPNLEIIQTEVNNLLTGNADQIREFLNKLDTFTTESNKRKRRHRAGDRVDQQAVQLLGQPQHHHRPAVRRPAAVDELALRERRTGSAKR